MSAIDDGGTTTATAEKEAFRVLAAAHIDHLYSLARRLVGDEAEDAVQDTLLKAYRSMDQLSDPRAARAWLTAILVNTCRDRARAAARRPTETPIDDVEDFSLYRKIADEDPWPYSDSLHVDFLHQFGRDDVRQVLLSLPEMYRLPLVLVHMDGYAAKEVARMVGAPLGTILARLHRGRKLFEKQMWDYAVTNGLLKEGATR